MLWIMVKCIFPQSFLIFHLTVHSPMTFIIYPHPLTNVFLMSMSGTINWLKLLAVQVDTWLSTPIWKDSESALNFFLLYYPIFSIFVCGYVCLNNINTFIVILTTNQLLPAFLPSYIVSWTVPTLFLACFVCVYSLKVLSDLLRDLIHFQIGIFAFCICLCALYFPHIFPNLLLNINAMVFIRKVQMKMSCESVFIRHGKFWATAMMIFVMYIMTLSHFSWLPLVSHSCYSPSLISVIMVVSALSKGFPRPFSLSDWSLELCVL